MLDVAVAFPPTWGTLSQCYSTHWAEQQCGHLCLNPVLSSIPTGVGGLVGFCRALDGVSNSGVFQGIPLVSHSDVRIAIVSSPLLLYHRCTAGAHSLGSSAKNCFAFACALPFRGKRQPPLACLLTLEGDWALQRDPISQSLWRYVSVPSFRERGLRK